MSNAHNFYFILFHENNVDVYVKCTPCGYHDF